LETEGEELQVKNRAKKCRNVTVRAKQELLPVCGWEDVTMGDDTYGKMMPPNKEIGPSRRPESSWGDKTYRDTISEKILPGKNIVIDEATIGIKRKIIFETSNKKRRSEASIYLH
jgi:hypothetical protein